MQLTTDQRVFIVTEWSRSGSLQQVAAAFHERFPDRNVPAKSTLWRNIRKYQQEGTSLNLNKGRSGRRRTVRSEENVAAVRRAIQENPQVSMRRNGQAISKSSFHRIVRQEMRWYPYRMLCRHQLRPGDPARRLQYSRWLLDHGERFLENIVIGDESSFFMNGRVFSHNVRQYAPRHDPPAFIYERNASREKVSVWCGLCGNGALIGPVFFNGNLDGDAYLHMIDEEIVPRLEREYQRDADGAFHRLWWIQDGAPAHRRLIVRERLQRLFQDKIVAMNHPVEWPPRSPDLTPCDYFLWGFLKGKVFVTPPRDLGDLRARIVEAVDALRQDRGMIRRVVRSMRSRAQTCIERDGGHVE